MPGGLARTPKRYRYRLIGPTYVGGPNATGLKGTGWEVIIRTNRKLPLCTPGDRKRYRLRLRDHQGRILESDSLSRFNIAAPGVWCYTSLLDSRAPSLLHALNVGDRVEVSLELLTEYPSPVGTRIARREISSVRAGDDMREGDRALDAQCYGRAS